MSSPSSRPIRTAKVFIVGCLSTLALLQVIHWLSPGEHEQLARIIVLALAAVIIPATSIAAWFFILTPIGLTKDDQFLAQKPTNPTPSAASSADWHSSRASSQASQQPDIAPRQSRIPQVHMPPAANVSSTPNAVAAVGNDDVTRPLIDPVNVSRWRLLIETGPEAGSQFPLKGPMLAGRAPYADLLLQSSRISREHARFCIENGTPMVTDLESRNGTHVNGRRINTPQTLHEGDEVRLHDVIIRIVHRDVAVDY